MARTTTTRTVAKATTRKTAKVATVTHGPAGTVLLNPPFILPTPHGRLGQYLRASDRNPEALGWTFDNAEKAWIMDGSAGKSHADMARVQELIDLFARVGVTLDVKLTSTGKARTGKAAVSVAADTAEAGKTAGRKTTRKAAAPAQPDRAEALRAVLASLNLPDAAVAAIVAAAMGEASELASAPAKATGKAATRTRATAARATAARPEVTGTTNRQGLRVFTLPVGMRVKAAGKAVRVAIAADVRSGGACKGGTWHVYADRKARTLTVECEGRKLGAEIDALVAGAIA